MKALTILQPFAELIFIGEKLVENRTWSTSYRGELAIHAGQSRRLVTQEDRFRFPDMPYGEIVATAMLIACITFDAIVAGNIPPNLQWVRYHTYTEGPICWILDAVRPLNPPVPYKGARGLFTVDSSLLRITDY